MTPLTRRTAVVLAVGILCMAAPVAAATSQPPQATPQAGVSLSGSSNPFQMVDPSSPEYHALQRLTAAGLVTLNASLINTGHPLTRYQAAMVAAEAINNAKALMHNGKSNELSSDEMATLALVYDDVKDDLTALTQRVDADERRIAALENGSHPSGSVNGKGDQGETTTEFKPSFEIHGEFRVRPVLQNTQIATAQTLTGVPVPDGTTLVRTGGPGDAFITTGPTGMGAMQSRMRLVGDGHITPHANFIVRLSTEEAGGSLNSTAGVPGLASFVHNDFSFFEYNVPNQPLAIYGGKLLYCCGTPWLPDGTGMIADAVPIGMAIKWTSTDPNHKASAWASVGAISNAESVSPSPCAPTPRGLTQNITMGHAEYAFSPAWKLQGQLLSENSQCVTGFTTVPVNGFATLTEGSITLDHQFSKYFSGTFEALGRFGNDPITKTAWTDNGAFWYELRYGLFGVPHGSGIDAYLVTAGKNSIIGNLDSIVNGVDSVWNATYLPYANNVDTFDVGYQWNFDSNALVRLDYATANLRNAERSVAGNLITSDHRNLLILTGAFNF